MYPVSSLQPSKRKNALPSKNKPKVNEAQSKDIMNQLFEDLDQNEVEDLEEVEELEEMPEEEEDVW